jgi:antirestriction protein ArdC
MTTVNPKQGFQETKTDLYRQVTDTIIRQLEAGVIPWQRPWKGPAGTQLELPFNTASKKSYKGINILLLWCTSLQQEFSSAEWATFRQWQGKGEKIRKGEKGSLIVFYDTFEKEQDGEVKKIPFLKSSVVFNRCQLQGYEAPVTVPEHEGQLWEKIDPVEDFVQCTGADIFESHKAAYCRVTDRIYMPPAETFITTAACTATEGYYSTLLHELTHWSGNPKRLDRVKGKRFGDHAYAFEELVAELGAAFLCAKFNITTLDKGDHAAYIDGWLKVLKSEKQFLLTAASEASKAADYLCTFQ